jgi:hypothetical protein
MAATSPECRNSCAEIYKRETLSNRRHSRHGNTLVNFVKLLGPWIVGYRTRWNCASLPNKYLVKRNAFTVSLAINNRY